MKGIILAGGSGTRLYPITKSVSKHLLHIYDKPMIYYPLSVLMLIGIREILIISTPRDISLYKELLGNGEDLGLEFTYAIQYKPRGIADAFIVGKEFIGNERVVLILGDNIFYGQGLVDILKRAKNREKFSTIFGYYIKNPTRFGVVEFDNKFNVISIEEKPDLPKSNYVVPGLYFYNNEIIQIVKNLKPSSRGELEITSVNKEYLRQGKLKAELFGRGIAWFDTGTHRGLLEANNFVAAIQNRQGLYIACIEEIAYRKGYINEKHLLKIAESLKQTDYGKYLMNIIGDKRNLE